MRIINGAFIDWPHFGLVNGVMRNLPDLLTQLGEGASELNASFEATYKEADSGAVSALPAKELLHRMLIHYDYKGYLPTPDDVVGVTEEELFKHHSVSRSRKILCALHRLVSDEAFMKAYVSVGTLAFQPIPPVSEVPRTDDGASSQNTHHVSPGAGEASQTTDHAAVVAAQENASGPAKATAAAVPNGTKRAQDADCVDSATKRFAAGN